MNEESKTPESTLPHMPDAETIRQELAKAKTINDLTGKDGVFARLFGQTLTAMLRRSGWTVNHKRVQRLLGELGLHMPRQTQKRRTTNSNHAFPRYPNLVQDLAIVRPDQVWVADITYIRLRREWVYLAVLMDVLTRAIRGWHLARVNDRARMCQGYAAGNVPIGSSKTLFLLRIPNEKTLMLSR